MSRTNSAGIEEKISEKTRKFPKWNKQATTQNRERG
jgi:hypothetical protein